MCPHFFFVFYVKVLNISDKYAIILFLNKNLPCVQNTAWKISCNYFHTNFVYATLKFCFVYPRVITVNRMAMFCYRNIFSLPKCLLIPIALYFCKSFWFLSHIKCHKKLFIVFSCTSLSYKPQLWFNDELKNICQVEHSRHRSFGNFISNLLAGLATYSFFPKKPSIKFDVEHSSQIACFY